MGNRWEFLDPELVKAFIKGQVILFIGAGFSKNVFYKEAIKVGAQEYPLDTGTKNKPPRSLPNWPEMLYEMLDWASSKEAFGGLPNKTEIKKLIAKGKYLIAGQELLDFMKEQSSDELTILLQRLFKGENLNITSQKVSGPHDLLPKLTLLRAIVTTNYDNLIETAYNYQGGKFTLIQKDDIGKIQLPLRLRDDFFVFKMHGQYDQDIVLGTRDYQDVMFKLPGYRRFIETLFVTNTVLFVGYSGDDPNLNSILDQLAAVYARQFDTHFILMKKGEMRTQTERNRLEKDKRVRVIEYDDYSDIQEILEGFEIAQKQNSQPQP